MSRTLLSIVGLALLSLPVLARAPAETPFILALVRDDGVILPVATHDRGRWRTPWPGPAREADVPVRLEDCPRAWWGLPDAPREWTLHVPGQAVRRVTMDRVTWVLDHCQQQVALHSKAAERDVLRPPDGLRAPKQGVAIAGDAQVTLPREVPRTSPEARALLDALQRAFNYNERWMLTNTYLTNFRPSVDEDERDRMPVTGLAIYAGPGRGHETVYFVELERRYPRKRPEALRWCDEVTYMAGWAYSSRDGEIELSLITNDVTSCLLDSVTRAIPQAIVATSKGPVWLLEEYRPTAEAYGLYSPPGRDGAVLITRRMGATCTRQ